MKRIIGIGIIFAFVGILLGIAFPREEVVSPSDTNTQSEKTVPGQKNETSTRPGIPKTLIIEKIDVSVPVEQVGLDSEKRMDIPKNWANTGWFMYGPRPGEKGNAAIDGHVDTPSGSPSVFYNLKSLKVGDEIVVVDEINERFRFRVTKIANYDTNQFPLDEGFGEHPKARLNLITCDGTFDRASQDYSNRVVAYSELIE